MASIVKDSRGRSPYWIACFADSTGRRLKKSTKQTNKKDALEFALAAEHGESLARKGAFTEARLREILEQTLALAGNFLLKSRGALPESGIEVLHR
jgi:hypothetical protein